MNSSVSCMHTDRGLNLKSKKQFGHSCSDFGQPTEHAEHAHFFLTLWLQDLYSMEQAKPGCIYPIEQAVADSRQEARVPLPALMQLCWVRLGEALHSPSVQRCWCDRWLLLVYLSVLRQWLTQSPFQAQQHPQPAATSCPHPEPRGPGSPASQAPSGWMLYNKAKSILQRSQIHPQVITVITHTVLRSIAARSSSTPQSRQSSASSGQLWNNRPRLCFPKHMRTHTQFYCRHYFSNSIIVQNM